jgi:hypothetical protein
MKYGLVALGHLDDLGLQSSNVTFNPSMENLRVQIEKKEKDKDKNKKSRQISVRFNQAKAFISSMKIGDWVVTIGHSQLCFGRIIGHSKILDTPLEFIYDEENDRKTTMYYNLRRRVSWGPMLNRSKLPYGLLNSFKANQTVFNIDSHWEAIHHTLYPFFQNKNKLYLSANLKTEENVNNYSMVKFLSVLSDIEVISKELDNGLDCDNFEKRFNEKVITGELTLTTKAQFHSPGDIWNALSFIGELDGGQEIIYAILAYTGLFGNKLTGFDGIIDLHTRQKLWSLLISRMEKSNMGNVIETLKLSLPSVDTSKLEDDSSDEH